MAFQTNSPVTFSLPPFRGVTRKLVLGAVGLFLAQAVLGLISRRASVSVLMNLGLIPDAAVHGKLWQFVTYAFETLGLLGILFSSLTVWIFGSWLEEERGSQFLAEYFFVSTIGGGVLISLIALSGIFGTADQGVLLGFGAAGVGVLLAVARMHPEQEIRFNFILLLKLKYLAALYLLFYLGSALVDHDRLGAVAALCMWLCGYLYLRYAPRRGLRFAASEGVYGMRNAYYRWKRRRAAKAFTVYMKKQGKDVSLDTSERYLDSRDPKARNDKRWMN